MKRGQHKHAFKFKLPTMDGKENFLTVMANTIQATKPVRLELAADDVRRSIKLRGVGNTQTCTMAVCAKRQADKFPHPVDGYIDWQYSRAYVVSKINPKTGFPSSCYVYEHKDDIAKINDTLGGQQQLLRELEKSGNRIIHLRPFQKRPSKAGTLKGAGKKDGSRSSKPIPRGARLRFAKAQLGLA